MQKTHTFIVAGIDTDVGKTVASAVLAEGLKADYWKPVQAGDLHYTDTDKVRRWVSNRESVMHSEAYRLNSPVSPHAAAAIDGVRIELENQPIPSTSRPLLIELAGGLMVPLREDYLIIDWLKSLQLPVILVSKYYLGNINHTLLSIDALQRRGIPLAGVLFNGEEVETTRQAILKYGNVPFIGHIEQMEKVNSENIRKQADRVLPHFPLSKK